MPFKDEQDPDPLLFERFNDFMGREQFETAFHLAQSAQNKELMDCAARARIIEFLNDGDQLGAKCFAQRNSCEHLLVQYGIDYENPTGAIQKGTVYGGLPVEEKKTKKSRKEVVRKVGAIIHDAEEADDTMAKSRTQLIECLIAEAALAAHEAYLFRDLRPPHIAARNYQRAFALVMNAFEVAGALGAASDNFFEGVASSFADELDPKTALPSPRDHGILRELSRREFHVG